MGAGQPYSGSVPGSGLPGAFPYQRYLLSESVKKGQKESAEKGQKKSNKKGKHTNHTKVLSLIIIIDKDLDLSLQAQNL